MRKSIKPFRNEVMDTVSRSLSVDWFLRVPRRGTIRMDVVSTARPRLSVRPLSDARFEALKAVLGVDDEMKQVCRNNNRFACDTM